MFRGLTKSAQKILINSSYSLAKEDGALAIEPEHILLAIVSERCFAASVLSHLGIDLRPFKKFVESQLERRFKALPADMSTLSDSHSGALSPSVQTRELLDGAVSEAKEIGDDFLRPEHFVLAIGKQKKGSIARYMKKHGFSSEVYLDIIKRYGVSSREADTPFMASAARDKELSEMLFSGKDADAEAEKELRQDGSFSKLLSKAHKEEKDHLAGFLEPLSFGKERPPIIERDKEISRTFQILCRAQKNNVIFVGDPGVGKTALAAEVARRIEARESPVLFWGKKVYSLNLGALVAGTRYRGELEERLDNLIKKVKADPNIILFVDEIHTLVGAGGSSGGEGGGEMVNILKPALADGSLRCIGATTYEEYSRYIMKDAALERRFQPLYIEEPSDSQTLSILKSLRVFYEKFHRVSYSIPALEEAVRLSTRYYAERHQPDKAIDLIDEVGAQKKIEMLPPSSSLMDIESQIVSLRQQKMAKIKAQQYEEAVGLRDEILALEEKRETEKNALSLKMDNMSPMICPLDVQKIVSSQLQVPLSFLEEGEERFSVSALSHALGSRLVGQDSAIDVLCRRIAYNQSALVPRGKTLGSYLFLGPTGVGKSYLAKELSAQFFGKPGFLLRFDMSEYQNEMGLSKLLGAAPGYKGYGESGTFISAVRRHPYSILLLDEIDKASTLFYNLIMQIIDEGSLEDEKGRKVSFANTLIIMTANINSARSGAEIGFGGSGSAMSGLNGNIYSKEASEIFPSELLSRLSAVVPFNAFSRSNLIEIARRHFTAIARRFSEQGVTLTFSDDLTSFVAEKAEKSGFGARGVASFVQQEVESALVSEFISGRLSRQAHVSLSEGCVKITVGVLLQAAAEAV